MIERDDWEDDWDYDHDPADECDHEDYEADILTGRAECNRCPHSWYQTPTEIEREIDRLREYDRWMHEEQMQEHWWGRAWLTLRGWLTRLAPPAVRDPYPPCRCGHSAEAHGGSGPGSHACRECGCAEYEARDQSEGER